MSTAGDQLVGRVLGGRYRLVAPVGVGASASVFQGDDVQLRRSVAIKVLHSGLAHDVAFLKRFRAEAQAVAQLNHPNVMTVFDWGEDAGTPYLVMEYLGGGSLRAMLDRSRLLTPAQALMVGLEAARGLDYAHRRGFVHRDIKPANLLFGDDGRLRIADFGLARAIAEAAWTEPAGVVLGTARYASPEQARGEQVDGRSDVYSLALTIIESVTGSVPFAAETTVATLMNRLDKLMPVSAELGPLAPILERAGRPDPSERATAGEFGRALVQAAERLARPAPLPLVVGSAVNRVHDTQIAAPPMPVDDPPTPLPVVGPPVGDDDDERDVFADTPMPTDGLDLSPVDTMGEFDRPRRALRGYIVALALLIVAGLATGGVLVFRNANKSHAVASYVGKDEAEVENLVSQFHWTIAPSTEKSDEVEAGKVIRQTPAGGKLKEGGTLAIVVSDGPTFSHLPDLVGKTKADAQALLDAQKLPMKVADSQFDENAPVDAVLSWTAENQALAIGAEIVKGTEVEVVLSKGPKPRPTPKLLGSTFEEAQATLAGLQLQITKVPDEFSDTYVAGQIIRTDPAAGTEIARGATVVVAVSKGPDLVTVPNVINDTLTTAVSVLKDNGLGQGTITGPIEGRVLSVDPAVGAQVKRGTGVNITMIVDG